MKYRSRQLTNFLFTVSCFFALILVGAMIASLFCSLVKRGLPALMHFNFYTALTKPPGMHGGFANSIMGSLLIVGLAIVLAALIGITTAVYLSEFSKGKKWGTWIRFTNDVLLSTPSIVVGLFCYSICVNPVHHFSGWAGILALSLIAIPIVVRTCEDMLEIVPQALRESALALGAPYWKVLWHVVFQSVYQGILMGMLLAMARILGEVAPLLFTSLNNTFWNTNLTQPMSTLPVTLYEYAMSPYLDWQSLAWGGALLITLLVTVLSLLALWIMERRRD